MNWIQTDDPRHEVSSCTGRTTKVFLIAKNSFRRLRLKPQWGMGFSLKNSIQRLEEESEPGEDSDQTKATASRPGGPGGSIHAYRRCFSSGRTLPNSSVSPVLHRASVRPAQWAPGRPDGAHHANQRFAKATTEKWEKGLLNRLERFSQSPRNPTFPMETSIWPLWQRAYLGMTIALIPGVACCPTC